MPRFGNRNRYGDRSGYDGAGLTGQHRPIGDTSSFNKELFRDISSLKKLMETYRNEYEKANHDRKVQIEVEIINGLKIVYDSDERNLPHIGRALKIFNPILTDRDYKSYIDDIKQPGVFSPEFQSDEGYQSDSEQSTVSDEDLKDKIKEFKKILAGVDSKDLLRKIDRILKNKKKDYKLNHDYYNFLNDFCISYNKKSLYSFSVSRISYKLSEKNYNDDILMQLFDEYPDMMDQLESDFNGLKPKESGIISNRFKSPSAFFKGSQKQKWEPWEPRM